MPKVAEESKTTYRLGLYGPSGRAWCIEKLYVPKKGKEKGKESWVGVKYPKDFRTALETAVHMKVGNFGTEDVNELHDIFMDAVDELAEELKHGNVFTVKES